MELKNKYRKNFLALCKMMGQQQDALALSISLSSPGTLLSSSPFKIEIITKNEEGLAQILVRNEAKLVFKGSIMIQTPKRRRYLR